MGTGHVKGGVTLGPNTLNADPPFTTVISNSRIDTEDTALQREGHTVHVNSYLKIKLLKMNNNVIIKNKRKNNLTWACTDKLVGSPFTILCLDLDTDDNTIGSFISGLPKVTSGIVTAHTTCAH